MFNCYCIYSAGKLFAIFKTEQACENFASIMNSQTSTPSPYIIKGRYIPDIGF